MKLSNFLDHPGLNQLRLSMGADSLAAPPRGWTPRLLDAESVMRLGQPDPAPPTQAGVGAGAPSARRMKTAPKVPVHYSRDRTSSKILNPIGLPKGALADDLPDLEAQDQSAAPSAPTDQVPTPPQQAIAMSAPAAPPSTHKGQPETAEPTAKASQPAERQQHERRRRRNQDALNRLRSLQGD
ncbi:MAG: hypothetical protein FJY35_01345 [Betaproteobacteria bacterium]|nr:hypothetical protein [Betaproteobacteria bacterium]